MDEKYQDYVIKDGIFIGNFEEMYQKFHNPWHQLDGNIGSWAFSGIANYINKEKFAKVLEVGCGLGMYTQYLTENCKASHVIGMDISSTAIKKASEYYSECSFIVGNVSDIDDSWEDMADVIIFADIMWYILENLDNVIESLKQYCSNKCLIIKQIFYKGQQQYGLEYFTNQDELINFIPFKLIGRMEYNIEENDYVETVTIFQIGE